MEPSLSTSSSAPTFEALVWCLITGRTIPGQTRDSASCLSPALPFPGRWDRLGNPGTQGMDTASKQQLCQRRHRGNSLTSPTCSLLYTPEHCVSSQSSAQHAPTPSHLSTMTYPSVSPATFTSAGLPETPSHAVNLAPVCDSGQRFLYLAVLT